MAETSSSSPEIKKSELNGQIPRKYWIAFGVGIAALALLANAPGLFAPSDEALGRQLVGKWKLPNNNEIDFQRDGEAVLSMGWTRFAFTWIIHDGLLDMHYKGAKDDMALDLAVLLGSVFVGGPKDEPTRAVRFDGHSKLFLGNEGPLERLGVSAD